MITQKDLITLLKQTKDRISQIKRSGRNTPALKMLEYWNKETEKLLRRTTK